MYEAKITVDGLKVASVEGTDKGTVLLEGMGYLMQNFDDMNKSIKIEMKKNV